jgi:hypothetical protein
MGQTTPILAVAPTPDGVWSVNERGPERVAIAYFPSKWRALKHAVRAAKAKQRARVAILEVDGEERLAHDYDNPAPGAHTPEVP